MNSYFSVIVLLLNLLINCLTSDKCGIRAVDDQVIWKIVGGHNARPDSWPWMASLRLRINPNTRVCGTTLLNSNWIITAAHCLQVDDDPLNWMVVFDGRNTTDKNEILHPISKIVIHRKASNGNGIYNDIALIKLNQTLDLKGRDKHLIPICLPNRTDIELSSLKCFITGWGRNRVNGNDSDILEEAVVPILHSNDCFKIFGFRVDINTNICASGVKEGGLGTCIGDSGGPLQCQLPNKQWYQFGITSWGVGCAKPGIPDVFTKVSAYYEWINEIIN